MKKMKDSIKKGLTSELKYAILKIKEGSKLEHWRIRKEEIQKELKRSKHAKRSKKRK